MQQELREASLRVIHILKFQRILSCYFQSQQQLHQGLPALRVRRA